MDSDSRGKFLAESQIPSRANPWFWCNPSFEFTGGPRSGNLLSYRVRDGLVVPVVGGGRNIPG